MNYFTTFPKKAYINMKKDLFVPVSLSKALKKLGFDEGCLAYYNIDPQLNNPYINFNSPFNHEWCLPAPLWQQAFDWIEDKYGILSWIIPNIGYRSITYDWHLSGERQSTLHAYNFPYKKTAQYKLLQELIKICKK